MMGKRFHVPFVVLACLLTVTPALAHDSWISRGGFRGPKNGEWCCGANDCFVVSSQSVRVNGTGYELSQTKETVAAGPAKVAQLELKGELVAVVPSWLIAKNAAGDYKLYNVQPGRKAIVDGVPKTLDQLQVGTMLTSTATTTPVNPAARACRTEAAREP